MEENLPKIRKLKELIQQSESLDLIINKLESLSEQQNNSKIEYGCLVEYTQFDGSLIQGRVWRIKSGGNAAINRHGYAKEILIPINTLTNLSTDALGLLEKEKWICERNINELKTEINKSNFDFLEFDLATTIDDQYIQIQVLNIDSVEGTEAKLITFKKTNSTKIRKIITANALLKNMKEGKYQLKFTLFGLERLEQLIR